MGVAYSVGEVDHLYTFFVQWTPKKYTEAIKKHCQARHFRKKQKKRFFADKNVINSLFNNLNDNLKAANNWEASVKDLVGTMKKTLENMKVLFCASDCVEPCVKFITVKQKKPHINLCNLEDFEVEEQEPENDLPVLSDQSLLLDDHHLRTLVAHLPQRTQGYKWNLVYSTALHGSSLKTLYRNTAGLDSPVLLVIKDMHKKVFGAFSSDSFRISKYCYGTGETFLFTFSPDFQQYKWSGENSYFVSGDLDSLQIGGGGGGFALWLDADLYHGASFSCPTFKNATLSTHEDFIVQDAEVWTVQN